MTDPPFHSRPLLGELFRQSQATGGWRSDERVLRTVDRVLETDYSAQTQQQRAAFQQQHPGVQYAPHSADRPGVPQFTPGVKAAYVAGTLNHRVAAGAALGGVATGLFMPGKAFGGSYNGEPATRQNRYFEKTSEFVKWVTLFLVLTGLAIGNYFVESALKAPAGARTNQLILGFGLGGFVVLCGFMAWYANARTNRKEAQIVTGIFLLLLAAVGWKLNQSANTPVTPPPSDNMHNTDGTWSPLGGDR